MGDVQLGPVTHLSPSDVMSLWTDNGGDPSKAAIAAAIVFSSENPAGNAGLVNDTPSTGDYSIGLWQVNYLGSLMATRSAQFGPPDVFASDPNVQARAVIAMSSNGTNWQAWGPDLGYSGYGQAVTDPTPDSRVGRWLATHGYDTGFNLGTVVRPILIAGSLLFLASLAANYFQPGTVTIPKIQRALRI